MFVQANFLDPAVCEALLAALVPAQVDLAVESVRQLQERDQSVGQQWQRRIERADYDAQLAQRRYEEVGPSNRLVASTLEQRWNSTQTHLQGHKAKLTMTKPYGFRTFRGLEITQNHAVNPLFSGKLDFRALYCLLRFPHFALPSLPEFSLL